MYTKLVLNETRVHIFNRHSSPGLESRLFEKKTQEEKTQNSRIRHNFNFFPLVSQKLLYKGIFFKKIFNGNHGILKYMKMRNSKLKVEFLSLL